jgi:hypothetical protein
VSVLQPTILVCTFADKHDAMKKMIFILSILYTFNAAAQKVVAIEYKGKIYEVLDMTTKGKITWGGYEEIGDAVRSEDNGAANTKAIVAAVGENKGFDGKPYAAKLCVQATDGGKTDWYLPAQNETELIIENKAKFAFDERATLWTSTEANGTQAVTKYVYTGAFYNSQKVDSYNFVCIRKVN